MQLVATATSHGLTFPRMASDRALPPAQNDALRRRLRDLVATKYGGTITHAAKALGVSGEPGLSSAALGQLGVDLIVSRTTSAIRQAVALRH